MTQNSKRAGSLIRRSLGLQGILLIFGVTVIMVGASSGISARIESAAMHDRMEASSSELSGLLRLIIDKPMLVGDDEATAEEFAFLSRTFPTVSISIASFKGNITYSTMPDEVRKDIALLHGQSMSNEDRKIFQDSYSQALKGEAPQGMLLSVQGRQKYLHVSPIANGPNCHHCHGASQPILGAMAVLNDVEQDISDAWSSTIRDIGASTISALLLALCIYVFIKRRIINRLNSLAFTSDAIVAGDFNARFTVTGVDELGHLSGNLSNMLNSLKQLGTAQSVLHGMSVPGLMCDVHGKSTFISQPLLDLLHESKRREDILNESANVFLYGQENPESVFSQVLANNKACLNCEETLVDRQGNSLRVRFDAVPVFDLEGLLIGAFSSITDLTAIRQQEAAVMEKNVTINAAAQEASLVAIEIGRASEALAAQVLQTREQNARQQTLSDLTEAELEEVNTAMADMAKNAGQAAGHAGDSKESAVQGAAQAESVAHNMELMVTSILKLKNQMEELGNKTANIGQVMQVIQDIADQTNLLALNAAIEAARAGDAGRGFAVVADEVRKLAEKTMQATGEVGRTIGEIRTSAETSIKAVEETTTTVTDGAVQVKRTGEALQHILGLAEFVASEVQSIASAVGQQSASTEKVRDSIRDIKNISSAAMTATTETEAAVRTLMDTAASLNRIIAGMTGEK